MLRKTGLKRGKAILRKTRLKPMSDKRRSLAVVYSSKRKKFLRDHPRCQAGLPGVCSGASCDVHHMRGRLGGNYLDELTWLATCRPCHRWCHDHPKEAKARGLLF